MKYSAICLLTLSLFGCNELTKLEKSTKDLSEAVAKLHESAHQLNVEIECLKEFVDNQWWVESKMYLTVDRKDNKVAFELAQKIYRASCRKRLSNGKL
jgi:hypothetical protein